MARRGGKVNKNSISYISRKGDATKALTEIKNNLQAAINQMEEITEEQLLSIGEKIKEKSNEYAPKDTGELRESAYVESEQQGDEFVVEIGYKADHAVYTHEIGPYANPTTPGTNYKYLQRAATEMEREHVESLADALKGVIR